MLKRALKNGKEKEFTLDIDATGIESEKEAAKMTYKGYTGYMPMVGQRGGKRSATWEMNFVKGMIRRGRGTWNF